MPALDGNSDTFMCLVCSDDDEGTSFAGPSLHCRTLMSRNAIDPFLLCSTCAFDNKRVGRHRPTHGLLLRPAGKSVDDIRGAATKTDTDLAEGTHDLAERMGRMEGNIAALTSQISELKALFLQMVPRANDE